MSHNLNLLLSLCDMYTEVNKLYFTPYKVKCEMFSLIYSFFYPTAFKSFAGIVFTHGVQMGGWTCMKKIVRAVSQEKPEVSDVDGTLEVDLGVQCLSVIRNCKM